MIREVIVFASYALYVWYSWLLGSFGSEILEVTFLHPDSIVVPGSQLLCHPFGTVLKDTWELFLSVFKNLFLAPI